MHLRIKAFYGTSENAVKTEIWMPCGLCAGGDLKNMETFAQLVRNFCALTPLIPTFLLFYIKITIRNLLIINALYAMSFSSQLLHTRR